MEDKCPNNIIAMAYVELHLFFFIFVGSMYVYLFTCILIVSNVILCLFFHNECLHVNVYRSIQFCNLHDLYIFQKTNSKL